MSDGSSKGLISRLKNAVRGVFYSQIPDHPSHGGNTGDTEWTPEDAARARERAASESENDDRRQS